MAQGDFQSTQAARQLTPNIENFNIQKQFRGKSRILDIDYTLTAAEVAAQVLDLTELIPGDTVQIFGSGVYTPNPGTALTIDIGDDDEADPDPDRYVDGLDISAGGAFDFKDSPTTAAAITAPYSVQNPCRLQLTFDSVTALNAVRLQFTVVITNNT